MSGKIVPGLCVAFAVLAWSVWMPSQAHAASGVAEPSLWARGISWIMMQQRIFHEELVTALKTLTDGGGLAAAWSLIFGSFLYGIFHAAGPGHGKVVLTTYLLTHPQRVSRGVGIAAAAALCQGLVAIVLVYGLIYLAGWIPRETGSAVAWSERISYILVAAIGGLLILRTARQLLNRYFPRTETHSHHHHHEDGDCCGHTHMPSGEQLEQIRDLRSAISVVLAIGLRPCTGAILVLVLARALTLPIAGVGAVLAMSAGTGIAVATLAFLAVRARQKAVAFTADKSPVWQVAANTAALAGGGLLIAIGISLLSASFYSRHPLGL
ncbi:nickel/cobalt transporter [uncultured Sneathiella sp.]|jgi:ABC-type nickel/cobalt efflux system permease component RcnA|uniref:nickel/cobalt transporter n=1 Tax=uncultured Sneathiella sp. TaxID=879315 RepID=UPI0030D6FFE5|tara:strand:+ start:13508 stop:14479 length:972 start_codon:yes stop_codon:yes gene_type:complete